MLDLLPPRHDLGSRWPWLAAGADDHRGLSTWPGPRCPREHFAEVTLGGTTHKPDGVDEEQEVPIFICRRPYRPLKEMWRSLGVDWG